MINVSTLDDARTAFINSGWLDRFDDEEDDRAARFLRQHASADRISEDEFRRLMARFAVEVVGWSPNDLAPDERALVRSAATIPTSATAEELDEWLRDQPAREWQREQLAFAAMGYLGMCRHPYLSADWVAHNTLYAEACNALSRIIDPQAAGGADKPLVDRIRATYEARGFVCNGS